VAAIGVLSFCLWLLPTNAIEAFAASDCFFFRLLYPNVFYYIMTTGLQSSIRTTLSSFIIITKPKG
jgi:hypothetical protein